jgi:hypothetical protein
MATTGVIGQAWRADVTATGSLEPWDGSAAMDWYVAADDRWHDPRIDSGVRHQRIDGTAVFETKLRIPGGDAVQRVWSVADAGGYTLVEVTNASSLPIAVAFTRPDVVANRPPADVPIQGIDLPAGAVLLPVGHRSTVVVGLSHAAGATTLPTGLPAPDAVARGWIARCDAASRLDLPEPADIAAVRAARCEALLCGPPDVSDDPERFLLAAAELVRMGEWDERAVVAVVESVAVAVERVVEVAGPLRSCAIDAAGVVLAAAGERRAVRDLQRFMSPSTTPDVVHGDMNPPIEVVAAVERQVAAGAVLFPDGIPPAWLGADIEAHGLVAGPSTRLSIALRWHGPNAAVLWEVTGDPVMLTSPAVPGGWTTAASTGEALWVREAPNAEANSLRS